MANSLNRLPKDVCSAVDFAYSIPTSNATLRNQKLKSRLETSKNPFLNQNTHPLDSLYKVVTNR